MNDVEGECEVGSRKILVGSLGDEDYKRCQSCHITMA